MIKEYQNEFPCLGSRERMHEVSLALQFYVTLSYMYINIMHIPRS
jgi:hypothetical protein